MLATAQQPRLTNRPPTRVFHQGLQSARIDCSMTVCSFSSPHPFAAHQRSVARHDAPDHQVRPTMNSSLTRSIHALCRLTGGEALAV